MDLQTMTDAERAAYRQGRADTLDEARHALQDGRYAVMGDPREGRYAVMGDPRQGSNWQGQSWSQGLVRWGRYAVMGKPDAGSNWQGSNWQGSNWQQGLVRFGDGALSVECPGCGNTLEIQPGQG